MRPIWIIGAGGHAKVVIDAIRADGYFQIRGVLDDGKSRDSGDFCGSPVEGRITPETIRRLSIDAAIIAIGDNRSRKHIVDRLGDFSFWVTIRHPSATISDTAEIGDGAFIGAGAVVQADAHIGAHTIINTLSSVDHDCVIDDFVHVAPGAHVTGSIHIDEGAFVGTGASIIPGVTIGSWSIVGAGSVVIRDIPARSTVAGVPSKLLVSNTKVGTE